MSKACLTVENLWTGFGPTPIIRGVSLQVTEGECLGLVGPNGHGKTTLVRSICGLHPLWKGSIRLRDRDLGGLPCYRRVNLGLAVVPENDLLFSDLTVEEHLLLASRRAPRMKRRFRVEEMYGVFPALAARRRQEARNLSGGERRMLALARALVTGADVVLVDEPSVGLAPVAIKAVYEHIRESMVGRKTLLIVEENPRRLVGTATRLAVLDRGEIIAEGPVADLLQDPSLKQTYLGLGS
jgi:branched-chain amino acid transport system ATP-binding protein